MTQSDTESVVKIIRKVEGRFAGFDEIKVQAGKRDRANQEIVLYEYPVSFANFPLEEMNALWLKHHLPVLKKNAKI